jgi:hypothetical protein
MRKSLVQFQYGKPKHSRGILSGKLLRNWGLDFNKNIRAWIFKWAQEVVETLYNLLINKYQGLGLSISKT